MYWKERGMARGGEEFSCVLHNEKWKKGAAMNYRLSDRTKELRQFFRSSHYVTVRRLTSFPMALTWRSCNGCMGRRVAYSSERKLNTFLSQLQIHVYRLDRIFSAARRRCRSRCRRWRRPEKGRQKLVLTLSLDDYSRLLIIFFPAFSKNP